jgi:hypothetical protein
MDGGASSSRYAGGRWRGLASRPGTGRGQGSCAVVGGEKTQLVIVAVVIRDAVPAALPAIVEIYDASLPGPGEG